MKGTFTALFFIFINQIYGTQLASNFILDASFSHSKAVSKDTIPQILNFEQLKPLLTTQSDSVFIINFWATWCAPCVAELPYFEKINADLKGKKAKVILVSLDMKNQIQTKLLPFLKKKRLQSDVYVLVEKDANAWIPKVNEEWSGSIPATLIFDKNKRQFCEQSFDSYSDLKKVISEFICISN